jgi:dihydrofolate synthase/folylpolyglutamate synthase
VNGCGRIGAARSLIHPPLQKQGIKTAGELPALLENTMKPTHLSEWFSYIESLHMDAIVLGLDRIAIVAEKLGVLHFPCPVITIAGTNGKGSCVAFLEAIFTHAGYAVGAYTSPHLLRFHERIRLLGKEISDTPLLHAFEQVEAARAEQDVRLTYFEFTTLAALYLFKQAAPDVLLLEVGLGGRLDAVNVIDPDVSVITTIALDHMDWLGDTREAIGYEKAGIFRPNTPAICGDLDPPAQIKERAQKLAAPLYCAGVDFSFESNRETWSWRYKEHAYTALPLPQLPVQNAATALMAVHCLQNRLPVSVDAVVQGLTYAALPGRFQRFVQGGGGETILDVAHNPAAAHYLATRLRSAPIAGLTRAVVGILADKDIEETLRPLLPLVHTWYVASLDGPRGACAEKIAEYLQKLGVAAYYHLPILFDSVTTAYKKAQADMKNEDRILVFGSFHTVAPILLTLHEKEI